TEKHSCSSHKYFPVVEIANGAHDAHNARVWSAASSGAPNSWQIGEASLLAIPCKYLPKQPCPVSSCARRYGSAPLRRFSHRSKWGRMFPPSRCPHLETQGLLSIFRPGPPSRRYGVSQTPQVLSFPLESSYP
ncbi:jg22950, partial [Pararge aegeria aegeria]